MQTKNLENDIHTDKQKENLNFIDRWNNGLMDKEEYQKIVDECLELID